MVCVQKGAGYHLDMLIVGIMMGVCSLLGLPWCVAATVLCLGHVDSLRKDSESAAPGDAPQFLGVREQVDHETKTIKTFPSFLIPKLRTNIRTVPPESDWNPGVPPGRPLHPASPPPQVSPPLVLP